jgi:2-polyprenyl-3-methyl-5-hydroxy-6-metoxy-1,4-benzoquinol methylase
LKRVIGRSIHKSGPDSNCKGDDAIAFDPSAVPDKAPYRFLWTIRAIENIRGSGSELKTALDVGACNGLLSLMMASSGLDVDAVEADAGAFGVLLSAISGISTKNVIRAYNVEFQKFETDTKYDFIAMFEVLEHTPDPLLCIEKAYEMLEIGGYLMLSLPEEHGIFGIRDKNSNHYWTSTVQSMVMVLFHDSRKWEIKQVFEHCGLIHAAIQKLTYQE